MKKSVVVFGLGRFGHTVASKLYELGVEVMAVDNDYDKIQDIADDVNIAVQCDFLDDKAMRELGLDTFDIAVVATASSLEGSIAALMEAKDHGISMVIAKASSPNQARILKKLGADQIIYPERDMGERLARSISGSNLLEFIHFSEEYGLIELEAKGAWIGKTLDDLDFRNSYHMNIVAIRSGEGIKVAPKSEDVIGSGDVLVLVGEQKYADKLEEL